MNWNVLQDRAWKKLSHLTVQYKGKPCGIQAASALGVNPVNYNQVFMRDFALTAMPYLMGGKFEMVRNFLVTMAQLQPVEPNFKCFRPGQGLMPVSFAVRTSNGEDVLIPDYGDRAIGRVAPADSGFWWLYLLRMYVKASGDRELVESERIQHAIRLCVDVAMVKRFDMYPTVLVPDGAYMIDRRMGVHGYPLDVQANFLASLLAAEELLPPDTDHAAIVRENICDLMTYLRKYYWLDLTSLNRIHRYQVEQYGSEVMNSFNISPESIPEWVLEWLPNNAGYFVGNVAPGRMDFRYFAMGNLLAVVTGLADGEQATKIMTLYEQRWDDLGGEMPVKLVYPALEGESWRETTGYDSKNWPWCYHNGGNWPMLLGLFAAASVRTGRRKIIDAVMDEIGSRLAEDEWPEYYDGHRGRLIGREARKCQAWTLGGYLAAGMLLEDEARLDVLSFDMSAVPESGNMPRDAVPDEDNMAGGNH